MRNLEDELKVHVVGGMKKTHDSAPGDDFTGSGGGGGTGPGDDDDDEKMPLSGQPIMNPTIRWPPAI